MSDISVVDLFCGVGGTSFGFRNAGLSVGLGVDVDPNCEYAFDNSIGAPFLARDVADLSPGELIAAWKGADVRVLAGCAPCQPFSSYTQGVSAEADPRWNLLTNMHRFIEAIRPEVIAIENVPMLAKSAVYRRLMYEIGEMGYHTATFYPDAYDFGVPQTRRRLVTLASRLGPIHWLEVPHDAEQSPRTVREAIEGLRALNAGERDVNDPLHVCSRLSDLNLRRIRHSRPGGSWREWPASLIAKCHTKASGRTYPSVYGRMEWDRPSPTITGQCYGFGNGRFGHPEQDRAISLREAALLQSFPRNFAFWPEQSSPAMKHVGMMIGNAVPPKLAEGIGRTIKHHVHAV